MYIYVLINSCCAVMTVCIHYSWGFGVIFSLVEGIFVRFLLHWGAPRVFMCDPALVVDKEVS